MSRTLLKLMVSVVLVAVCQVAASADDLASKDGRTWSDVAADSAKGERIWSDIAVGYYLVPMTVSDGNGNVGIVQQQHQYETGVALVRDEKGCKVVALVRDGDQIVPTIVLDEAQKVRELPIKVPRIKTNAVSSDCGISSAEVRRIAATL